MSPLALGRLTTHSHKTPKAIALYASSTFKCPFCQNYLAIMMATVYWSESDWWINVESLGLNWTDEFCICKHCHEEVDDHLRFVEHWDQVYFMPKPIIPGGHSFV